MATILEGYKIPFLSLHYTPAMVNIMTTDQKLPTIKDFIQQYKVELEAISDLYRKYKPAHKRMHPLWSELEQKQVKDLKIHYFDMLLEVL